MKPRFLEETEEAFAVKQHVIFRFNTTDRFYWPEDGIGPAYLQFFLAKAFQKRGYRVAQYSASSGFVELNENDRKSKSEKLQNLSGQQEPHLVLNRIVPLLRDKSEKWLVLIHYGEHLAPAHSVVISASSTPAAQVYTTELLHLISLDDGIAAGDSRVTIITYGEMPADLVARSVGYRVIEINHPSYEERLAFIEFLQGKFNNDFEQGLDSKKLSAITSGIPLVEVEKLYRSSSHHKKPISREQVKLSKARAIKQLTGDLLEVSEPEEKMADVAGLDHLKEVFLNLAWHLREGHAGVPQSILLNGTPGCGKSLAVRALASELGWVLIEFRSIRGPYVGQSESQLELVIRVAEQFDHSVIFFDEIDQLIGQRGVGVSGDSGTSERMLARIMTWIGSMKHRGKILFVGASNRPDLLDQAILDRFPVSVPILHPARKDIAELLPLLAKRFHRSFAKDVSMEDTAAMLAPLRPTGRGLQEIIINAGLRADKEKKKVGTQIGMRHLEQAAAEYLPVEDPLEMEFISLTSLAKCSSSAYLPWMSMEGLRPDAEIPAELVSEGIVDEKTGRLDKMKLHQKLRELAQARQYARIMR